MFNDRGQPIKHQIHTGKVSSAFLDLAGDLLQDGHDKGVLQEVVAMRLSGDDACQVHRFLSGMELGVAVALINNALGAPCIKGLRAGIEYGEALLKTGKLDLKLVEIVHQGEEPL